VVAQGDVLAKGDAVAQGDVVAQRDVVAQSATCIPGSGSRHPSQFTKRQQESRLCIINNTYCVYICGI
jgi:hypothetical protein